METRLDCLPCFLRQGLYAARLVDPNDYELHRFVVQSWSKRLADLDLRCPPPLLVGDLYALLQESIDTLDPFAQEKRKSNIKALDLLPTLRSIISQSKDHLLAALEISIIGNYIDSGVGKDFHWEEKLQTEDRQLDMETYQRFVKDILSSQKVMILGDNAGEIALDILLVEELQKLDCQVTYVVREKPVINDATLEDARFVGLVNKCHVISSGVNTAGTVLSRCSKDFLREFNQAPVIISKGQGNLEALLQERSPVYYAFKVKCQVISDLVKLPEGNSAFLCL
jgi:hypothetical protein